MNRCVIIGGGPIENYNRIKSYIRDDDFVIACDCGLRHCQPLGTVPDLIVGDFDSFSRPDPGILTDAEIIQLPVEKDDTDTMYAVKEASARGFEDFLLTGMTGRRLDHTLGNVYMLIRLHELGLNAMIADDYSEISLAAGISDRETDSGTDGKKNRNIDGGTGRKNDGGAHGNIVTVSDIFPYFSVIAITGRASGICIRNAKYPLEDAVIEPGFQYGISNEVLPGMTAEISVHDGALLVIRDIMG